MVTFLTTSGITYRLENIIKSAQDRLILVSPYLKIHERLKQTLDDQDRAKIDIRVVYGKNELQPEEHNWLASKTYIRTSYCKNLHAKCFLNESEALITSMNLYEYSQVNNEEMGILVERDSDPEIYGGILQEAMRLIRISEELQIEVKKVTEKKTSSRRNGKSVASKEELPKAGMCIRCKTSIPLDPTRPYCKSCYSSWSQYSDADYVDKYCHVCGTDNKSTLNKPTCYSCYRKYRSRLTFPLAAT